MRYQVEAQWMMTDMVLATFYDYQDALRFAEEKFVSGDKFADANIYIVDTSSDFVYKQWERKH